MDVFARDHLVRTVIDWNGAIDWDSGNTISDL